MAKRNEKRATRASGVATRKRVLGAAARLFADGGYEATSLRTIASASDIDLATLKYHFGDKPTLFAEVYRLGHSEFVDVLGPIVAELTVVEDSVDLSEYIRDVVSRLYDFLDDNRVFSRLVLYRMMEDSSEIIGLEEELQGVAMSMLESVFNGLHERKLIRDIDVGAFVTFVVSALPMWFVTVGVKPKWVGEPRPNEPGWRPRVEAFFSEMLLRMLVPDE